MRDRAGGRTDAEHWLAAVADWCVAAITTTLIFYFSPVWFHKQMWGENLMLLLCQWFCCLKFISQCLPRPCGIDAYFSVADFENVFMIILKDKDPWTEHFILLILSIMCCRSVSVDWLKSTNQQNKDDPLCIVHLNHNKVVTLCSVQTFFSFFTNSISYIEDFCYRLDGGMELEDVKGQKDQQKDGTGEMIDVCL